MNERNTQIALFDDSKRVVANLMARENITVQIIDGIPTAAFDPITRVLSIPAWTKMTVDQIDTLMGHEVGHALFSDNTLYEKMRQDTKSRGFFTYFNVVEDARIERKMRESFPGLARVMHAGYKEFYANGPAFQGTTDGKSLVNPKTGETVKIDTMRLIDRINVHFKVGAFCHVTFTPEERVWVERIAKAASMDEAIEIARQLHKLAKEQDKPQPQNPSNEQNPKPSPKTEQTEESDEQDGDDQQAGDSDDQQDGESQDSDDTDSDGENGESDEDADEQDGDETDAKGDESDADDQDDQDGDDESDADGDQDGDDESDDQDGNGEGDDESDEQGEDGDDESKSADADESDDEENAGQGDGAGEGDGDDSDPTAATAEQFEEALKDLAKSDSRVQVRNLLISPVDDKTFAERTVSASDWTEKCYAKFAKSANTQSVLDGFVKDWEEKHLNTAKLMALEFERRKTAKALQHAKTAKTGKLNLAKLSQYRFSEDLFHRTMTVPTGKSHGIVMVIDASGSMSGCFANVIDQVLLFAHFAFQVNIPFEAYMFTDRKENTDNYDWRHAANTEHRPGLHQIALSDAGRIVGLVNTRTDRGQFKRQVRACLALRAQFDSSMWNYRYDTDAHAAMSNLPYSRLGGTPLYTGIMLGEKALANMKRDARLDKTSFIVVTDGQDGNGLEYTTHNVDQTTGKVTESQNRVGDTAIVVRDTVTKKQFSYIAHQDYGYGKSMVCPAQGVISMLMDIIKVRHDARTIYLFLQEGGISTTTGGTPTFRGYRRRRFVNPYAPVTPAVTTINGMEYVTRNADIPVNTDAAIKSLKDEGQFVLPTGRGVADLSIILRQAQIVLTDDAFAKMDASQMTQRKIAAEFTKTMVKAVANRVFVGTVIGHLA